MADAIELLEADHREVDELFVKAESTSGAARSQVVAKICTELTVHAQVEEEVIYPAMRKAGLDDLVSEAEQEHGKVKQLVATLEGMDGSSADIDAVVAELKRDVEHHVHEEEATAFPRFREAAGQEALDVLGPEVQQAKKQARGGR